MGLVDGVTYTVSWYQREWSGNVTPEFKVSINDDLVFSGEAGLNGVWEFMTVEFTASSENVLKLMTNSDSTVLVLIDNVSIQRLDV
jgi:hypothetical protein